MIRASDLTNTALWTTRPAVTASRGGTRDASNWFDEGASTASARVSSDVNPAARGLSVEQHASLVLAHLCGDNEA